MAAGAVAVVGARRQVHAIASSPDPYPYELVSKEPVGETTFVERPDGTRIRVVSAGTGPTVVLAHGIYMSVIEWTVLWDLLLERGYRVVAFDQRGHGRGLAQHPVQPERQRERERGLGPRGRFGAV